MSESLTDLHERIVAALRDADGLRIYDVGIALDTARLHLERRIIEAQTGLVYDSGLEGFDQFKSSSDGTF